MFPFPIFTEQSYQRLVATGAVTFIPVPVEHFYLPCKQKINILQTFHNKKEKPQLYRIQWLNLRAGRNWRAASIAAYSVEICSAEICTWSFYFMQINIIICCLWQIKILLEAEKAEKLTALLVSWFKHSFSWSTIRKHGTTLLRILHIFSPIWITSPTDMEDEQNSIRAVRGMGEWK